ncbi:MAG: outer membrane lipoprotein-sorting protein [Gracilimonas sp.]|uniref:outer membrane lipoprotein-sorting protein n=1 Tax=Gracilimonas sp. TaxID=1974203 RepID=UPI003752A7E4|nr:outer membrane lipoprotein-sorting protein [Gracilimonas sp.]
MKYIITVTALAFLNTFAVAQSAEEIIQKVDENMISSTQISTSEMVIYGRRNTRTVTSKNYAEGTENSFTEYLSPAREKGTKMLKLDDQLWIYNPSSDRTIQISGHMLKQSVMGSDLSYEDMMEERELVEMYEPSIIGEEEIDGRQTWKLELNAIVDDPTYERQTIWVDQERFVPLKQEMFAKSGRLLKRVTLRDVQLFGDRWYPTKMNYKDVLKDGKGTDFIISDIEFDVDIPAYIFTKASLRK